MSEKTFLITMDESCFMTSMGWCVCGYGSDKLHRCDGEINDRPEWCPLIPVVSGCKNYHGVSTWVHIEPMDRGE